MKTYVQRWGDSLAVRIPAVFATALGVTENSEVDLDLVDGMLAVRTCDALTLDDLVAAINHDDLPGKVDTGGSVGAEVW